MSQEETYIPGVGNNSYGNQSGPYARRNAGGFENVKYNVNDDTVISSAGNAQASSGSSQKKSGGHVYGFLYSISSGSRECWMIKNGKNTIGRSSECDICLEEMTVSKFHAYLNVRQMKSTGKLTASIQDAGSSTSIFVNDEELESGEIHSCKHMDVLTIGENYKLLLLLIDAEDFGLSVSENFMKAEVVEEEPEIPSAANNNGGNPYDHNRRRTAQGTVDASGMQSTTPGGTKYM